MEYHTQFSSASPSETEEEASQAAVMDNVSVACVLHLISRMLKSLVTRLQGPFDDCAEWSWSCTRVDLSQMRLCPS
eukprot:1151251-Pelagomonas_calceolata.AAC.6